MCERGEVWVVELRQVEETGPVEAVEGEEGEGEDQPGQLLNVAAPPSAHSAWGRLALQLSHSLKIKILELKKGGWSWFMTYLEALNSLKLKSKNFSFWGQWAFIICRLWSVNYNIDKVVEAKAQLIYDL